MDDLFDPSKIAVPEPEGPETVWELTARIRDAIEIGFPAVWVVDPVITNFAAAPTVTLNAPLTALVNTPDVAVRV